MILRVGALGLGYPTTEQGTRGNSCGPKKRKQSGEIERKSVIPSLSFPFCIEMPTRLWYPTREQRTRGTTVDQRKGSKGVRESGSQSHSKPQLLLLC